MKTLKNLKTFNELHEAKKATSDDDILKSYIFAEDEVPDKVIDKATKLISVFLTDDAKGKKLFNKYVKDNVQKWKGKMDWAATLNDILVFDEDFQKELYAAMTGTKTNEMHEAKTDKKVGVFSFEDKKYDIFQDSNDSSGFGIKDKSGSWDVIAMGDEFNPESFDDMDLPKMNKWIDAGIKHFSAMKTVSSKDVKNGDWSDFFQNEFDEESPIDKFYVLAKLTCGKENAKSNF
jgi:hypothetical protein